MKKITRKDFLKAFKEEWISSFRRQMEKVWNEPRHKGMKWRPLTHMMLDKGGFLDCVRERLQNINDKLNYYEEMYKIDAAFVSGKLCKDSIYYPSALQVLIEHELDKHIEEETWKLIFWRCPLKVLIFYDYDDHMKKKGRVSETWLEKKIPEIRNMIRVAEAERGVPDQSEYLFIVGARKSEQGEIYWQWTTDEDGKKLMKLIGE